MTRSAIEIEEQILWENRSIQNSIAACELAIENAKNSGTVHGLAHYQNFLNEIFPKFLEKVKDLSNGLTDVSVTPRLPEWGVPFLSLPPETLCAVAINVILTETASTFTQNISGTYISVSNAIWEQLDFDSWRADQKKSKDPAVQNLARAFDRMYPKFTKQQKFKWRVKTESTKIGQWDKTKIKIPLGAAVINCVLESVPDYFYLALEPGKNGHAQNVLRMTFSAVEKMRTLEARKALAFPKLLPMIVPPNDWVY